MKLTLKIFNIILIAATFTLLTFEAHMLFTRAQEGVAVPAANPDVQGSEVAASPSADEAVRTACIDRMEPFREEKRTEFGEFINDHFRSELPTSSLIPMAIDRFRQYHQEIEDELRNIEADVVASKGVNPQSIASSLTVCRNFVSQDFAVMKDLLHQHIVANAFAKKSTRLLDKYKELNGRLERLNMSVAQMYGYFSSFAQRLPCYATKCQQG